MIAENPIDWSLSFRNFNFIAVKGINKEGLEKRTEAAYILAKF